MKKQVRELMIFMLVLAMMFSTFTLGAYANTENIVEELELQPAQVYGELDLTSSDQITVIVELREESIVEAKHMGKKQDRGNLAKVRKNVVKEVQGKVKDAKVNREYDYLFSGFSVELPANEVLQLLTVSGIKAVYPNVAYTTTVVGEGSVIDKEVYSPEMFDSAPFIGSKEAWDIGYTGEGITVAVVDTGADYTHPDLDHAFGDYKGWDFVDNDNDPMETIDDNPELATSHGTHVSGTIAANGFIKGVAPEATLLSYRVLGPGGSGSTENVMAGIEKAVQDGADVMNLSLGNSLNSPDYATSIALDWAMAEGVVAVTSNGNSGPNNWTVGSPGASRRAISVGATQLPYNVYSGSIFTSEEVSYESTEVMGFPSDEELLALDGNSYEFVYVGLGYPEDFEGKDLEGKIALISRGDLPFVEKSDNAKAAGAIGTIIFNHLPGQIEHFVAGISLPTIKLSNEDGQKMLAELEAENNTVTFDFDHLYEVGETMADFSSRGPAAGTWMIKPDVSAPGVNIISTVPGGYAAKQGTSMASPHVAGAAALVLQANPEWGVEDVKAALMNTAKDIIDPATGESYSHNTQGAGSIRVVEALNTKTLVTPGSHSFGKFVKDSGAQVKGQSFTIKNLSNQRKNYSYEVEFEGNPAGIKVMISNNLNIPVKGTQQVNFNVQVDTSKLDTGYYEGVIKVNDGTSVIIVPTILFVGEPDYPRVTGAFMDFIGDGNYYVGSYLPGGAEVVAYDLYVFNAESGTIGGFVDTIGVFENATASYHEFLWDGTVQGGIDLPNGDWVLAVYVEQAGVTEYKAYLVTKE